MEIVDSYSFRTCVKDIFEKKKVEKRSQKFILNASCGQRGWREWRRVSVEERKGRM